MPEPPAPLPPVATLEPEPQGPAGTPWERRSELGFLTGWYQTVWQALFEPGKLFASARTDRGSAQLGFAVLTTSVFTFIGQVLSAVLFTGTQREIQARYVKLLRDWGVALPPNTEKLLAGSDQISPLGQVIGVALLAPLFAVIFIYLNAGVTHLFGKLIGDAKKDFDSTFAAAAYACAPVVLVAIPGCGGFVALIWTIVLTGVGMHLMHGMTPGRAVAAVLGPYLFICCGCCALSALSAGSIMRAMGQMR